MKDLTHKAMTANLKISFWTASKIDKNVTKEIEEKHNATDAGRFNKILIAKKELEELKNIAGQARLYHYEKTLPWGDNGDRLLPSAIFLDYISQIEVFQDQFNQAVQKFIKNYPDLKEDAKLRLNKMFNEEDYPSLERLKDKFEMKRTILPIANIDDVRIGVSQSDIAKMRDQMQQEIYDRINGATKDIWLRIKDAVKHMYDRLSNADAVFRNSLVTNISDLVEFLPKLNFTNDYEIARTIEEMKKLIVNPDDLRSDLGKRSKTAENAKDLLTKINDFLGFNTDELVGQSEYQAA